MKNPIIIEIIAIFLAIWAFFLALSMSAEFLAARLSNEFKREKNPIQMQVTIENILNFLKEITMIISHKFFEFYLYFFSE